MYELDVPTRTGMILIDTDGERVGQVNGLSVLALGNTMFGNPSRITARVRLGKGEVIDMIAPCSACYLNLKKAVHTLEESPRLARRVRAALGVVGREYTGGVEVRHPLDVFVNDVGIDRIAARAERPLAGLKVVPYYGCQIVRLGQQVGVDRGPRGQPGTPAYADIKAQAGARA